MQRARYMAIRCRATMTPLFARLEALRSRLSFRSLQAEPFRACNTRCLCAVNDSRRYSQWEDAERCSAVRPVARSRLYLTVFVASRLGSRNIRISSRWNVIRLDALRILIIYFYVKRMQEGERK